VTHDEIANIVLHCVAEESGKPPGPDSTLIGDLGLDSLNFVHLALMLEERLSIGPIPDDDLFKLVTVDQIVRYAEAWIEKKSAIEATASASTK
jgi:acyl carrier protein